MNIRYKRHDRSDIAIHWINAACWLLLLISGLGLIQNHALNPLGESFPEVLRAMAGGAGNLLIFHEAVGIGWLTAFILYLIVNPKGAGFFLKEIFNVSPARDMTWMVRKMVLMTLGEKALKRMGQPAELPPQGFYNMGQKGFAQVAVIGSMVIAATGLAMLFSDVGPLTPATGLTGWAVTLHYLAVGLVFAGLLVHIYMAAISPEERPGFKSMFTGSVPEEYARHHHRLWYDRVNQNAQE
ncbi:formate dehydrogenase subunit gamma [Oleidesulfovibrio sp.]|uniref:formate dehydrogenase subunit gamma n=1 Tax=Oleidesulfovibrio sp. TaxID=2909707 RepID=UPI003A835632